MVEIVGGEPYEYVPLGEHIVRAVGVCGGRPTFKYTRVEVRGVLDRLALGDSMTKIVEAYEGRVAAEAISEAIDLRSFSMTEDDKNTLYAVVDRIIPPDDFAPGGAEAGAFDYLVGMFSGDLEHEAGNCRAFLDELGPDFAARTAEAQDAELQRLADSDAYGRFFRRLCEWTQEGFYTSPAGMTMIGWEIKG